MGHVAPHRLADAAAGRLNQRQLDRVQRHLQRCAACNASHERIVAARQTFGGIRDTEPPSLHWEHIGARIYWVTSSEKRAASRSQQMKRALPRRFWAGLAGVSVVAAAVVLLLWGTGPTPKTPYEVALPAAPTVTTITSERATRPPPKLPAPARISAIAGVVTFASGEVQLDGVPLGFDVPLRAGHTLRTKRGSVAVQFDASSGFLVGPESTVTLRSFDSRTVELVVVGSVSVNMTRRTGSQYFAVIAGNRRVEVRGTAFRVDFRGGRLGVACVRGHVIVTDTRDNVDVRAGQMLAVAKGDLLAGLSAATLQGPRLVSTRKQVEFAMLPAWADANAMLATSATLRVQADPGQIVKVDGMERGRGAFALRVMSGRHHVESAAGKGQWVELAAGKGGSARVVDDGANDRRNARAARALRHNQLQRALHGNERLRGCLRPLIKQGMDKGAFIVFDLGITRNGTIGHLNIINSNVPEQIRACMREIVDYVKFPRGPAATIHYRAQF